MNFRIFVFSLICGFFINSINSQETLKICATDKHTSQCSRLQRGKSEVTCQWVQDSIECANRLINGTADFGVFTAESTLQISILDKNDITVVKQLRHRDRFNVSVDFESVVVVRKDHQGGLDGLRGKQYCHPGLNYGRTQRWSERFLKQFERKVLKLQCKPNVSPAELEVSLLSEYFGKSCRPGVWSHDIKEDAQLKKKYPNLCALCNSQCKYDDKAGATGPDREHQNALNCLRGGGDVAYVSREDAEFYFKTPGSADDYRYLCPNGQFDAIQDNPNPCVWLRQPWKTIISRSEKSNIIKTKIDDWRSTASLSPNSWEDALMEILDADSYVPISVTMQRPNEYIRDYREIPRSEELCDTAIKWCTQNVDELEKCQVIQAGVISTGIFPEIICKEPLNNVVDCMEDISKNGSDFMGIDSNYGYMARKIYNLTAAMYFETEIEQYSSVVTIVHDSSKYKRFEDLKGAEACIPEFGGTASIAFVNIAKQKKIFNKNECRYGHLLSNYFGDSCAPGAEDFKHHFNTTDNKTTSLCTLCSRHDMKRPGLGVQINTTYTAPLALASSCLADDTNRYYGNKGALRCLQDQGDVAILELQSLREHALDLGLNENNYRIICKNNTRAKNTGFEVDSDCVLTTIVDGEVVILRGNPKLTSIVHTLNAIDSYFQNDPTFKMFNIFNSKRHLLFKDSTLGLVAANEDSLGKSVENYVQLFKNVEDCVQGNSASKANIAIFTTFIFALLTRMFM